MANDRKYAIINSSDIPNMVFDENNLLNKGDWLRKNNDLSKAIVSYSGTKPSCIGSETIYTHSQILSIINDPTGEWYDQEDENS